jgi:hypothetical protein
MGNICVMCLDAHSSLLRTFVLVQADVLAAVADSLSPDEQLMLSVIGDTEFTRCNSYNPSITLHGFVHAFI